MAEDRVGVSGSEGVDKLPETLPMLPSSTSDLHQRRKAQAEPMADYMHGAQPTLPSTAPAQGSAARRQRRGDQAELMPDHTHVAQLTLPSTAPAPARDDPTCQHHGDQSELVPDHVHDAMQRTRLYLSSIERFEHGYGGEERPRGDQQAPRGVVVTASGAAPVTGWDPSYDMWDTQDQLWPYRPPTVVAAARKFMAEHSALVEGAEASLVEMRRTPSRRAEQNFRAQLLTMQRQRFVVQPLRRRVSVSPPRGPLLHQGLAGLMASTAEGGPWDMPERTLEDASGKIKKVTTWSLEVSIWAPRGKEWGAFYNEGARSAFYDEGVAEGGKFNEGVAEKAFARDWYASMAAHGLVKTILSAHPMEYETIRLLRLDKSQQLRLGVRTPRVVDVEKELWAHHKLLYATFNYYAGLGGNEYGISFRACAR